MYSMATIGVWWAQYWVGLYIIGLCVPGFKEDAHPSTATRALGFYTYQPRNHITNTGVVVSGFSGVGAFAKGVFTSQIIYTC